MQVHEKSILIPLLPITLLAPVLPLARWTPAMAVFSMAPLLRRDGLTAASLAVLGIWAAVLAPGDQAVQAPNDTGHHGKSGDQQHISRSTANRKHDGGWGSAHGRLISWSAWLHARTALLGMWAAAVVCAIVAMTEPPARYPFLHDAAFTCVSFLFFVAAMCELAHQTYIC
jgi:alpha-1,3-glucosyltransferase